MAKHATWLLALGLVGACSNTSGDTQEWTVPTPDAGGAGLPDGGSSGGSGSGSSGAGSDSGGTRGEAGAQSDDASRGGGDTGAPASGALLERLVTSDVTVPAGVKPGDDNFRVWGQSNLNVAPVFTAPLANCGSLVCFTAGSQDSTSGPSEAYVAVLDATDKLVRTIDLGAYECRGVAAEPDGHFAALLWANGTASDCMDLTQNSRMYMKRYDIMGTSSWTTELVNTGAVGSVDLNCPVDWSLGESRMDYGGGSYGAYYHVHCNCGHEGDTLKYVDSTGVSSTTWTWGCSHSMSNLLRYHPTDMMFLPVCVTDCYPGTSGSDFATSSQGGLYTDNQNDLLDMDAGCDGNVAGEVGGAAPAPTGWKMVFNAHQAPLVLGQSSYSTSTMNQDIGFVSVASDHTKSGSVVWLTSTPSIDEADSSIARWQPAGDASEQYAVGWAEPGSSTVYKLARVDAKGALLEGPVDVTAKARWGRRDDPFRAHGNADVVWAWFDAPADTTLHFARLRSGGTTQCAGF